MADLTLRILGEDVASASFEKVKQTLIDFAKESVKAFAESERSQRQLQLVAKDLTDAFSRQAQAMAELNNISDESVQGIQTMLLRYGQAPAAVEATTQAILDYAAATGTDAQTATEALTRGVEAGTGHFKAFGFSIESTGDKTKDMALAVDALSKKFGGAGAADAESLNGQLRGAKEAFGELQESFGGFIAYAAQQTGLLGTLTEAMRGFKYALSGQYEDADRASQQNIFRDDIVRNTNDLIAAKKALREAEMNGTMEDEKFARLAVQAAEAQNADLRARLPGMFSPIGSQTKSGILGDMYGPAKPSAEDLASDAKAAAAKAKVVKDRQNQIAIERMGQEEYGPQTYAAWANSSVEGPAAPTASERTSMARAAAEQQKRTTEEHKKALDAMAKDTANAAKALAAQQKEFAKAGADIGAAFVNNISGALEQLATGGEQDAGKILASILAGVLSTVGSVVGNLLLPGIGGALGGALGGLAGAGVRAAANAPTINVNTFDSRSTREFFESDGGRGFYNAQRTGRGQGGR